jgi:hypothetical protein
VLIWWSLEEAKYVGRRYHIDGVRSVQKSKEKEPR